MSSTRIPSRVINTFSIVARDPANGDVGVAVASKFLAVGSAVPWAEAEVGAVATQSYANTSCGPRGLAMMKAGLSATEALERLIAEDEGRDQRQLGVVDVQGRAAAYTGKGCYGWAGHLLREGVACQGNILTGPETLDAMVEAFECISGQLSDRLSAALKAGDEAGGDRRGKQAAALLVMRKGAGYGGFNDVLVDVRVDDHLEPVPELGRLLDLHHLYFGTTPPEEKVRIDEALVREFQERMRRFGYYDGAMSGAWDEATQSAFRAFVGNENFEERVDIPGRTIDPPALDFIRKTFGG